MRSLRDEQYFRNRTMAQKEYRENPRARQWTNAIRGLRLALMVQAEAQREAGVVMPADRKETP